MLSLSPIQSKIVLMPTDKAIQILASAGSGKTRVLTERIRHIINTTKKDGVIALTFTNKAAEEMCSRLSDCENIQERAWISTIHSVAQRILEKYGHTLGLPMGLHIYDRDKDKMEVFMQSLRDDGINIDDYLNVSDSRELKGREKTLQNYMDIFSKIKRELLTEVDVANLYPNNNMWKKYQEYQDSMLRSGGIDYDDILVYAYRILITHEWIAKIYRAQYKHICVDEAQDLNKIQYEFIKAFCGESIQSIFMVGDPNQMIYGFNGSSKDYLCKYFIDDFSPEQFELKENYRSTKAIIRAVNKLKHGSQTESEYALEGSVSFLEFENELEEANLIVSNIKHLISIKTHPEIEGEITLDKMVVIARNRFVFSKLEISLKENGISYSLRRGERQLEPSTRFGKTLDYAIRIKLNSKDWVNGKKLCQLLNISEPKIWSKTVLSEFATKLDLLENFNTEILAKLLLAIDDLDIEQPKIPKLINDFRSYLTSLVENQECIADQELEDIRLSIEELNEFSNTWTCFKRKGLGDSLVAFRNALALGQLSENSIDRGLTLSTVHTMKGLEKDIVFLIGMCEGIFPDYRANSEKEIDEERNNAFVAVTRAKRWLYISYPKQRVMPWGDSRFQRKSRFMTQMES